MGEIIPCSGQIGLRDPCYRLVIGGIVGRGVVSVATEDAPAANGKSFKGNLNHV